MTNKPAANIYQKEDFDMEGNIHSIETFATLDGPGTRFVVFLQGCSFRCLYCHNPDTWQIDGGTKMSAQQIVDKLLRYKPYYGEKGGITLSGGEPLLQARFAAELLSLCKQKNVHTALDTAGSPLNEDIKDTLNYTDLVLLDIKHCDRDKFKYITGKSIDGMLEFFEYIKANNKKFWVRQVIVPAINDSKADVELLADMLEGCDNLERVELLGYHSLGLEKWHQLGLEYKLEDTPDIDPKVIDGLTEILKNRRLPVL